jgi:hypothetical protein
LEYGSGAIGSVEEIHIAADGSSSTRSRAIDPIGYHLAFRAVERLLHESLRAALTCHDAECFSTGPISGNCVVRAEIINIDGNVIQVI